jgi:hypothetical protein
VFGSPYREVPVAWTVYLIASEWSGFAMSFEWPKVSAAQLVALGNSRYFFKIFQDLATTSADGND